MGGEKTFDVVFTETYVRTVRVTAEDEDEAWGKATEDPDAGELMFESNDGVEFVLVDDGEDEM